MNKLTLINQLKIDEGIRLKVYLDTGELPTVGVGHLVTRRDKLKVGDVITEERCNQLLEEDISTAVINCYKLFPTYFLMSEEVQQVLANMMFNLGINRLGKFKKFIRALNEKRYSDAADEMKNSIWYTQVGNRAKRLEKIIRDEP